MVDLVTSVSLWELIKHAGSWVVNLRRASATRKEESVNALRQVILAAQKTSVYIRHNDTGYKDHNTEAELSTAWTELSFKLEDLGIDALAQRCRMKGMHWANPNQFASEDLEKADIGLQKMEALASEILSEVRR